MEDEAIQKVHEIATAMAARLVEVWGPLVDAFNELARQLGEAVSLVAQTWDTWVVDNQLEFILAHTWASGAHPEWVAHLNHTKKKRTRKKYQDRILRAYRARGTDHE